MRVRRKFLLVAGGCFLASLIVAWAAPNLLRWRMRDSERSAPQSLYQVDEAVKAYTKEHRTVPPTLSSLQGRYLSGWSCETTTCDRVGYRFQYTVSLPDPANPRYVLSAQPLEHGITGVYSYYLDQTGILRCTKEPRAATNEDPPLDSCHES